MKYSLQWIIKHKGTFDFEEEITFPCEMFEKYAHINGLKDVIVSGTGNLDTRDKRLYVDLNIKGTMILPCALTLEDVDYPFDIDSTEVFSFEKPDPLEDVHEAKKDVVWFYACRIFKYHVRSAHEGRKDDANIKESGKGWKILDGQEDNDEEYIDPRLAKLKDYFKQ